MVQALGQKELGRACNSDETPETAPEGPVVSSAFSSLCYDGLIATHMLAHAYRYLT
ncbi:hypothetical protein F2Q69_00013926 [Brassica cretica]|uniref:Uncharacterized protein n=1 Tax=Brassica cretica TaxID=69181 RepID=A0A8S9R4E4_BRACR|nr:hypothetical protein F2Q69_00013926 [Brassica cretica]